MVAFSSKFFQSMLLRLVGSVRALKPIDDPRQPYALVVFTNLPSGALNPLIAKLWKAPSQIEAVWLPLPRVVNCPSHLAPKAPAPFVLLPLQKICAKGLL